MAALVPWLAYSGARKVDGTPVASGSVYFYQPGTTNTPVVVYSDKDGLTAISQPLVLDAAGRGEAFAKVACRIHVLDSLGNLVKVLDRSNTVASAQVEVEVTGFTGTDLTTGSQTSGGRTDLATILSNASTSLGGIDFKVKPTGAALSFNIKELTPYFTPQMFGALGDNSNDDTSSFQSTITAALSYGRKIRIPPGTYRILSPLTIATKGVVIEGENRDDVILKNMSSTANLFTIDLLSAIDSKITIRDLSITASTTSSGTAISVANGDRIRIENVAVALHRFGIDVNAVSGAILEGIVIESTDDNASAIGINLGARSRANNCEVISGTVNGTGIKFTGADARATDCFVTKFVTGINLAGARGVARGCHSTTATTGIVLGAADSKAEDCYAVTATTGYSVTAATCRVINSIAGSCTTGFSVGAIASAVVTGCNGSSNTTDITVNASATLYTGTGNSFSGTISDSGSPFLMPFRCRAVTTTSSASSPTFTPDISLGRNIQIFEATNTSGASLTINAPVAGNQAIGDLLYLVLQKTGSNGISITNWSSSYKWPTGVNFTLSNGGTINSNTWSGFLFFWDGTVYRCLWYVQGMF